MWKLISSSICLIGLVLMLGLIPAPTQAKPASDQEDFSEIDSYIESQMTTYHILSTLRNNGRTVFTVFI